MSLCVWDITIFFRYFKAYPFNPPARPILNETKGLARIEFGHFPCYNFITY